MEKILNRPAEVAISNTSGLAGIAYWINTHFQLKPDNMVTKHDALVSGLKEEIDKQYVDGRTTVMSEDELLCIIDRGVLYKQNICRGARLHSARKADMGFYMGGLRSGYRQKRGRNI